ncbi:DNA adenine methylase [Rathayibacter rubneri]|uniref:DNA adenine methylase n=1 Tax=Rathayibacter rubneri TaxID=2950106 RepID=UPI003557CBF0
MSTIGQLTRVTQLDQRVELDLFRTDPSELARRAETILSSVPRPIFRWAGSKQRLLSQLVEHIPLRFKTYYEPFLGAASMYFLLRPQRAVLNDSCGPLIEAYRTISSSSEEVFLRLSEMDILDKDYYYQVRGTVPADPVAGAARFLYLNRAAWNGLYRVNARGQFNVPYGNPRSSNIIDENHLRESAKQLASSGTLLLSGDFEVALSRAGAEDFVFLDPPYASSKRREGFVDYNEKLFTWEDQMRLAEVAETLRARGARVVVTNAFNSAIRDLYPNFREYPLVRRSSLASDVSRRRPVAESALVA